MTVPRLVVTRFGEPRLSRASPLSQDSPDVVATGISLWPAATRSRSLRRGTARWSTAATTASRSAAATTS